MSDRYRLFTGAAVAGKFTHRKGVIISLSPDRLIATVKFEKENKTYEIDVENLNLISSGLTNFEPGERVQHPRLGKGTVKLWVTNLGCYVVLFDDENISRQIYPNTLTHI
jgi:hypothetical protein